MYFIWKSKLFTSSVAISSLLGMIQARISSVLRLASPFLSNSESNLEGFTSQRTLCWRTNKPFLLRDQPFFVLALTSVPNILLEAQLAIFISVFLLQDLSNGTNLLCAPLIKTKRKVTKQSNYTNLSQNMRSHGRILFGVREGEELFDIKTSVSTDICSHEEEPDMKLLWTIDYSPPRIISPTYPPPSTSIPQPSQGLRDRHRLRQSHIPRPCTRPRSPCRPCSRQRPRTYPSSPPRSTTLIITIEFVTD